MKREFKQGKTLLQFGFLKAVGQALGMVAPLVIGKFFASTALTEEAAEELYGRYSLAKMILFFFTALLITCMQAPFVVFANKERSQSGKINKALSVQLTFLIVSFSVFFGTTLPFQKYVARLARIDHGDVPFVLLAFVGMALKQFMCNLFLALGERIKNSLAELVFGCSTVVLIIVFYFVDILNLRMIFLVYPISGFLVVLILIKSVDFKLLVPFSLDKSFLRDMFNFTKWIMMGATAVFFINWGGTVVLRMFTVTGEVSLADIGTYSIGSQVFKGITMLIFIVNAYFLPFISEHIEDKSRLRDYLYRKRPKILLLGLAGVGLLFAAGPAILRIIYGDVYQDAGTVIRILVVGSAVILYGIFYTPIFNALQEYRFTQTVNALQALVSLLLAFLLVPAMGITGAALATVCAYFGWAVAMEVYFRIRVKKLIDI